MWEDIEAASLVELACERLADGRLDVVFVAHWELGAAVAAHWYGPAIVAARPRLEEAFRARRCVLTAVHVGELATALVERDGEPRRARGARRPLRLRAVHRAARVSACGATDGVHRASPRAGGMTTSRRAPLHRGEASALEAHHQPSCWPALRPAP